MDSFFDPEFFRSNRRKLRAQVADGAPIIITGNGQMQRSGDEASKFHQDSTFWYLTGLNGPDLTLVITAGDEYLIVPTISFEREAFDGAHDLTAYGARSGIKTIVAAKAGWARLRTELQGAKKAATLASPPAYMERHGLHTLPYRRRLLAKLKRMNAKLEFQDLRPELARMRCVKQPAELKAIQRAVDITTETLQEVVKGLGNITHENQLEAALTYGFRMRRAEDHAFWPIAGAGMHTTTLHHFENNGPIAPDDLIILDVGAEVEHYAADVARTDECDLLPSHLRCLSRRSR